MPAYPKPYEFVRLLNTYAPEIIFLEVGSSEDEWSTVARQIRSYCPKAAIIGFAQHCDGEQLIRATRAGVAQMLIPPFSGEEFQQVLAQALDTRSSGVPDNVVAFAPSKAGSGSTLTALNAAGSLARIWKQKVLLIDADVHSAPILGARCGF